MSKKARRTYQPEEKLAILKEHLVEGRPVSEVCERHGVQPSMFYYWQRQLFENGALALGPVNRGVSAKEQRQVERIAHLEARLARKDQVIAELSEDLVQTKKELGEL